MKLGSGGPVPYRIYVDSGVVMLCVFSLAPAAPMIAIAAFFYFVCSTPMLRWTMIFLYKPKFDIGGGRFPFIFDMCISGIIVGQTLLIAMMTQKRALGPAFGAFMPMFPTIAYRYILRRRYLRAFSDAALLQTSLLVSDTKQGFTKKIICFIFSNRHFVRGSFLSNLVYSTLFYPL